MFSERQVVNKIRIDILFMIFDVSLEDNVFRMTFDVYSMTFVGYRMTLEVYRMTSDVFISMLFNCIRITLEIIGILF